VPSGTYADQTIPVPTKADDCEMMNVRKKQKKKKKKKKKKTSSMP
jgi:pyruvate/2-oxoglutarate dehydrogenase complex dihydrolipoamide acyltransferase (E2) component